MKLTIPARDVRNGDRFMFADTPAVAPMDAFDVPANAPRSCGLYLDLPHGSGTFWVEPDAPVTVERDAPDAALIERMAEALETADQLSDDGKAPYATLARTALAVVRAEQ